MSDPEKRNTRQLDMMELYLCEIKTLVDEHGFKWYRCEVVARGYGKEGTS